MSGPLTSAIVNKMCTESLETTEAVTTYNKAGLSTKFIPHLNIRYQMALDLLIYWRDIVLWFLPVIKCRANVLHLLTHLVPQQCIPILTVKINCLLHILRDLYPELVSLQPILGFYLCNDLVPPLQSMSHLPSECGIH